MRIKVLSFDSFFENNCFVNYSVANKNKRKIKKIIKPNLNNIIKLINYNKHNYNFSSSNKQSEYLLHYVSAISNVLFAFNDILLNLLYDYCNKKSINFYTYDKELQKKLKEIELKNKEVFNELIKYFNIDNNIVINKTKMQEFNNVNNSFIKKIKDNTSLIVIEKIFLENQKKINKKYYKKYFSCFNTNILLNNNKCNEYNDKIDILIKIKEKNVFCIEKFIGIDNLFKAKRNNNSIKEIVSFFYLQKIIPKDLSNVLTIYEKIFRHQYSHGWVNIFKIFSVKNLYVKGDDFYEIYDRTKKIDTIHFNRSLFSFNSINNYEWNVVGKKTERNTDKIREELKQFTLSVKKETLDGLMTKLFFDNKISFIGKKNNDTNFTSLVLKKEIEEYLLKIKKEISIEEINNFMEIQNKCPLFCQNIVLDKKLEIFNSQIAKNNFNRFLQINNDLIVENSEVVLSLNYLVYNIYCFLIYYLENK